jgi:hypothetical protein
LARQFISAGSSGGGVSPLSFGQKRIRGSSRNGTFYFLEISGKKERRRVEFSLFFFPSRDQKLR